MEDVRDSEITVYVDGACRNNGHLNPQGGCGVYWGEYHPLNTSECLTGDKQTNNRAELMAAIIALQQAKQINVTKLNICTDSKYVRDGITKWILSWVENNWKTKQKSDVLNKDLWQKINMLTNQIDVQWRWVEGHTDVTGNIIADELAKLGISSEKFFWQNTNEYPIDAEQIVDRNLQSEEKRNVQSNDSRKCDNNDSNCGCCEKCVLDDGIQCGDCKNWFHYICSKLPPYQLYMYEVSNRKFTCEKCSGIDSKFISKFEELSRRSNMQSKHREQNIEDGDGKTTKSPKSQANAETQTIIKRKEMVTQTEITVDHTLNKRTNLEKVNKICTTAEDKDTQTQESYTTIDKCFTNFQDVTVQRLENSFVNAVEIFAKGHNNITDLQKQVQRLTHERDILKAQKQQPTTTTQEAKKCNCQSLQSQVNNLELETGRLKQQCSDLRLDKEIELSKLQGSIEILNQKYESKHKQVDILQQDIGMLEKRLNLKNETLMEFEENTKKYSSEIIKLQDEVLAWKMHASRQDDTLILEDKNDSSSSISKDEKKEENSKTADVINKKLTTKKNNRDNTLTKDENTEKKSTEPDAINKELSSKRNDIHSDITIDKKNVLLIGTSNLKFINPSMMSNEKVKVKKEIKYTLDAGQEYVDSLKLSGEKVDAIVLHLFENDISEQSADQCSDKIHKLCTDIQAKSPESKIIVSMGLPRRDNSINMKIMKLNYLLQETVSAMENVTLCDNSNLFYRGKEARGVLNKDGKHLSRLGTRKLGANLKSTIYKTLGENWRRYEDSHINTSQDGGYYNNTNGGRRNHDNLNSGRRGYRPTINNRRRKNY